MESGFSVEGLLLVLFSVVAMVVVEAQPSIQIGATECYLCGIGSYSSTDGAAQCSFCQAGYYASNSNNTGCDECPAGTYSAQGLCTTECL